MRLRERQKTLSRISNLLKQNSVLKTDLGNLIFRIDSAGSIPHKQKSQRSEQETFEWINTYLKPEQTFIDIGANIGIFSLYAGLKKNTKIISLEPSAETFATLNANIRLNNLEQKIQAFCLAASDRTELTQLFMNDQSSGASHNNVGAANNQFGKFTASAKQSVFSIKLDDFMNFSKFSYPDHMKLDVDGNELKVLKGSSKILKKVHSLLLEIEGKNLKENYSEIKHLLTIADLEEDIGWRNKGSKRNRLFLRK
tara:strand:+ start:1774 stop:2535 length:762 start_codon:yes stop_codon:yes gene_type:complete